MHRVVQALRRHWVRWLYCPFHNAHEIRRAVLRLEQGASPLAPQPHWHRCCLEEGVVLCYEVIEGEVTAARLVFESGSTS